MKSVAISPPDGYNFALTNITHLVLAPISNPKLGYDPLRDLTNIAYVAGSPIMISVNAKRREVARRIHRTRQENRPGD